MRRPPERARGRPQEPPQLPKPAIRIAGAAQSSPSMPPNWPKPPQPPPLTPGHWRGRRVIALQPTSAYANAAPDLLALLRGGAFNETANLSWAAAQRQGRSHFGRISAARSVPEISQISEAQSLPEISQKICRVSFSLSHGILETSLKIQGEAPETTQHFTPDLFENLFGPVAA